MAPGTSQGAALAQGKKSIHRGDGQLGRSAADAAVTGLARILVPRAVRNFLPLWRS